VVLCDEEVKHIPFKLIRGAMKRPIVFGFYGKSNTGKTSLMVKVIKRLVDDDLKVATVKITDKNIGVDTEGKDTWKHGQAGASLVVLSSLTETDFLLKQHKQMKDVLQHIGELGTHDIVLVEGAHEPSIPKIRIGDAPEREHTILSYDGDFDGLIQLIMNDVVKKEDVVDESISIRVNGKKIPLTEFPSAFIKETITGMLTPLKGVDEINDVEISFKS
jgi:molybdopterin-guanine dinucleotide biosynthesis protein B